jgi:uncharacterized membrane protein
VHRHRGAALGVHDGRVPAADPSTASSRRSAATVGPWVLAGLLAVVYSADSLARVHRFDSRSWDLAIFEQVVRGYAWLEGPVVDVQGPGANFFADHFSPALAVLAPVYRVVPLTGTLLVLQALLVAGGVLVVTRLAVRHAGTVAGLAVGLAYGLSWGVQSAVDFDFHEVALAVPLLALAGTAYVDRRWRSAALWAAPLVLVKEDLALTSAAVGVVLLLAGARRWGAGLLVGSLVAFALVTVVLIPAVNPGGVYRFWPDGDPGGGVLERLLGLPVAMVWPPEKLETLLLVLAVTGALALRSPWFLVAVPNLVVRFASDTENYWSTDWHYSLTTMTVVFVALVDAVVRLRRGGPPWLRTYATHVPAVAVAVALVLCLQFPFRALVDPATYDGGVRARHAEAVLELVPEDASVASDIGLLSALVGERDVYWVGSDNAGVLPDYVVLDADGAWGGQAPPGVLYAEQRFPQAAYERVYAAGGFQVMRRTG